MEELFHSELEPFFLQNVRLTGKTIGRGAYGSVEKVAMPGAICAAKKIHDFWLDPNQVPSSAIRKASAQFVRECQLMSILRHPHIVQFLGVCFLPGSRLPALVMELLLTSLHDLLDPEIDPPPPKDAPKPFFPLDLKVSILHDVASGLAYLHERSPPVIHRDLSARNVLLNSGMVAKVADLGVARIVPGMDRAAATMTKGPGAIIYMPPEAMESKSEGEKEEEQEEDVKSRYDCSIDVFSFGVVAIFTLSQTFPCDLLTPTYRKSGRLLARTELKRRKKYMAIIYEQLRKKHPLLQMIEGCLDFPERRPVINVVLGLLEEARAEERDEQTDMNKLELIQTIHNQCRKQENVDLERELTRAHQLLRQKDEELEHSEREKQLVQQQLKSELRRAEERMWRDQRQIETKDRELAEAQQQLRQKEEQLQSSQALMADLSKDFQQRMSGSESLSSYLAKIQSRQLPVTPRKITVECHQMMKKFRRPIYFMDDMTRGSATSDSQFAYFNPSRFYLLFQYEYSTEKWVTLPDCRYKYSGLVIINNELTTVGGLRGDQTNKLMTLRQREWVEEYPSMIITQSHSAVVTTSGGNYLIVIGGRIDGKWSAKVELLQLETREWYTATELPKPFTYPSATFCSDQLNVIGYEFHDGFSCSIQHLPSSDQPITSPLTLSWTPLPPLPAAGSTAVTLCGQLALIGGYQMGSAISCIHQLMDGQWMKIGSMNRDRGMCLAVSASPEKILIIGGLGSGGDSVEECIGKYELENKVNQCVVV